MLKRKAYSLIWLANVIILAHAIVPHHYHFSKICFGWECLSINEFPKNESEPADANRHDTNTDTDLCCFSDFLPKFSGNAFKSSSNEQSDCNSFSELIFMVVLIQKNAAPLFSTDYIHIKPKAFNTNFKNSSFGLRAPPVFIKF